MPQHSVVPQLVSIVTLFALTIAPSPQAAHAQNPQPPMRIDVERIRPDIYVASGFTNGNVLIVIADTGVLLVDAQSLKRVGALDSALRVITPRPVRTVINTHYHGDHTEGNAHFHAGGAIITAHANVRRQAVKDTTITDWQNWHRTPLPAEGLPTREFGDSMVIPFGDHRVVLLHPPNAHTDGDAIVWLPRANVLHTGDILEMGAPPFIDWWVGGPVDGMLRALDQIDAMVNDSTRVVPGHGRVSSRTDLRTNRAMLATIGERVRAAVSRGESLAQVKAAKLAAEYSAALGSERRADEFVTLVYYGESRRRTP